MATPSSATESVVRRHLQAFIEQHGVDAIVQDYADNASFLSEDKVYLGKTEIRGFFHRFIEDLPADAVELFTLRSLRVDGQLAHITWSAGSALPLGTDTFVVKDGKIASQTFAMYVARPE
jgi:ketosteroid isomerase-like protein